ncbi:cilia- and flagella-associated protein 251-like [Contarinia nasturtii]|uniref:cilia- and flagella-associated protein 251-like n=1 Tax=Contarinia nasturtii TaxID=265458 RepID=UPI0012D48BE2|nr:cilia- and flagella-associated protein 251-like [Contarinia nasturtii]XP_031625357.1 cilia- and flagella-associated protein 251-like [Contarinia nasturtii]
MPRLSARKSVGKAMVNMRENSEDEEMEEPEEFADSGEDWQPEKQKDSEFSSGKGKRKSAPVTPKRAPKKSRKNVQSEEEEEEVDDEDEFSDEDGKKVRGTPGKNQPDKDGNFELNLFKNDLTDDFRNDDKMCMWRRDGSSLLQKYMMLVEESEGPEIIFKASSVYSCWEEKRKNDFVQVRVTTVGDKKDGKVKVIDIAEFEKMAAGNLEKVDTTPKGAEGGENYEEGSECEEDEEDEEDEDDEENYEE